MNPIIKVENISKLYQIGAKESYGSLRDEIMQAVTAPFRRLTTHNSQLTTDSNLWALKDVSFEVNEGEVVGIIGRNGAGKSTLLKILSRITEPTSGKITMRGRVASLLEVGTGFHPELTGRENIFLNGALLGMTQAEIRRKFDEIVAFSEIEKFLDTPVKRYSSGMYVRLAFAVAAHLEPEILVIDEVLAVGDAQFQKKCLGKMGDVAKAGRTVLFVSHNMAAVENLCTKGIVLENGKMAYDGQTTEAIKFYLKSFFINEEKNIVKRKDRRGEGNIRITKIEIEDQNGEKNIPFPVGSNLCFRIDYDANVNVRNPRVIIGVYDLMNTGIARFDTDIAGGLSPSLPKLGQICCSTETMNIIPGRYFINIAFFGHGILEDYIASATFFDVVDSDYFGTGKSFDLNDVKLTKVLIRHKWGLTFGNS